MKVNGLGKYFVGYFTLFDFFYFFYFCGVDWVLYHLGKQQAHMGKAATKGNFSKKNYKI
jgi:hypothetical protein